jgi:hypothetical protein
VTQINMAEALCHTQYASQARLWDDDLDGNEKNARAETPTERRDRHLLAKAVCSACTQSSVCYFVGRNDPSATGIYGGRLV